MRWIWLTLLVSGVASPAWALAQAASPQTPGHAAEAQTTAPEATKGVLAEQRAAPLPGVTVTGRRLKPCAPRDQACIDDISKEIWERYPTQIETLCTHEAIHDMQQGYQMEQLGLQTNEINTRMTAQTRALCQYGAKMKREAKRQAQPAATPASDPDALPKP